MARIPPECQSIQDEVDRLQATIRQLQEELQSAPPAEKPIIIEMIRREREKQADAERRLSRCIATAGSYLDIVGVEYTQATQYFDFNGQGSGYAPDNSVPLVARKSLFLRIYVARQAHEPPLPSNVSGTLRYNLSDGSAARELRPLAPIAARAANEIQRGKGSHTLNFRIPAADCVGTLRFSLTLFDPGTPGFESTHTLNPRTFRDVPMLRVHGVLINYTGNGGNLPAPTGQDLIDSLELVRRMYPISGVQYTGCTPMVFGGNLAAADGCGGAWDDLLDTLANMRDASGTNDIFVALLPPSTPTNEFDGCGRAGVCAGIGDTTLMAHEIGHALGRHHVAGCRDPNNVDDDYPQYEGLPAASIGEFGVDQVTTALKDPTTVSDLMSYCPTRWISPYTYIGVMNRLTALAAGVAAGALRKEDTREHLFLNIAVHRTGRIELLPSYHLRTSVPSRPSGRLGRYSCELLDASGAVLRRHRLHHTDPHQCTNDDRLHFHEVIAWRAETRSIAVLRDGQRLGELTVAPEAPALRVVEQPRAAVAKRPELMKVEWQIESREAVGREGEVTSLIRYSHDGGGTWRAIAANVTGTSHVVNTSLLPGGDQCVLQVVASNGIRSTTVETEPFQVERKPRQAYLLSPRPGATFTVGEAVVLHGGGFSPDLQTSPFDDVVWSSSRDGALGVGYEVVTQSLSPGRHRLTMSVPDGFGGEASASVWIDVVAGDGVGESRLAGDLERRSPQRLP